MFKPQPKPEKTPKKKKKRIKPISEKRMTELAHYSLVRAKWLRAHPACEVCGLENDTICVHHKLHNRTGQYLNDTGYFMSVCHSHHVYIHEHPAWAYEQGYLYKGFK